MCLSRDLPVWFGPDRLPDTSTRKLLPCGHRYFLPALVSFFSPVMALTCRVHLVAVLRKTTKERNKTPMASHVV
eukprot:2527910-Rhodomonas_salina.2